MILCGTLELLPEKILPLSIVQNFKMLQLNILRYRSSHFIIFVLLLLMLGPAQSSWCIHDGDAIAVPDMLFKDCHYVPLACLASSGMPMEQSNDASPVDCDDCLDLTFEEYASTISQNYQSDLTFTPNIAYFQPPSMVLLEPTQSRSFLFLAQQPFRKSLNLHRSIQSTVLII